MRGQLNIPVSIQSLDADGHPSLLRQIVLEFEHARPGDRSLRAALTGDRRPAKVQSVQRGIARTTRNSVRPAGSRRLWTPQPLRPPLAAKSL